MAETHPEGPMNVDEALRWIADLFETSRDTMHADTRRADVPAWDSLGQLVLMSALDHRYGIRLSQGELASLRSIQDILAILANHGRLRF